MLRVAYGTITFWGTNMFIRHSVFTSVLTFSGNAINTIISPRSPKGARKEGRKKDLLQNIRKHTYISL